MSKSTIRARFSKIKAITLEPERVDRYLLEAGERGISFAALIRELCDLGEKARAESRDQ